MGKLLRRVSDIVCILILSAFISTVGGNLVHAQLKLDNLLPFELEISSVSDLSNKNYWKLAPSDSELISLFGVREMHNDAFGEGHFLLEKPEGHYLGARPAGNFDHELLKFRVTNETGKMIDRIQIALDLAFLSAGNHPTDLYLFYEYSSVSDSERLLRSNQFRSDADQWQSTSLNTLIENMLMGPGESVDLKIIIRGTPGDELADAIALRRIEIMPEEFEHGLSLSVGDLVITEIFPGSVVEGERLHYVEIYNSTFETINLRGLNLKSGNDEFRIRRQLEIGAYQAAVIANRSIEYIDFYPDYVIHDLEFPSHGGMVELVHNGNKIMRAAFDEQQAGSAWELKRVIDVMDGYATMSDFQQSQSRLSTDFYGSPGNRGSTERVFTYKPGSNQKWKMLSAPGILVSELNPENSFWTGIESIQGGSEQISQGSGFLKRIVSPHEAEERWVVRESDPNSDVRLQLPEENNSLLLLGNPYMTTISFEQVRAVNGDFGSYIVQTWDDERQSFVILEPGSQIKPWQAFIVENRDSEAVLFDREMTLDPQQRARLDSRTRSISFGLQSGDTRQGTLTDLAARLYFHEYAQHSYDALDAQKLWPVFQSDGNARSSLIYFIGQKDGQASFLAQDARPYELENPFEVRIGHISYNVPGAHILTWDQFENIPDNWSLKLTDLHTGITMNMRDEDHLVFDGVSNVRSLSEFTDEPRLQPLNGSETYERFSISVNPFPDLMESGSTSDTKPDRVELYQNYPNPFNPVTNIRFYLPEQRPVVVGVYNVVGQRVAQLKDEVMPQGEHTVVWDATEMPSGIYIIHLEIGNQVLTRKMTLIK